MTSNRLPTATIEPLICPKCTHPMETYLIHGIDIDRCCRCKGIWFDLNEKEALRACKGAAHQADIGHPAIGEYYNQLTQVSCPRCAVPMFAMTSQKSSTITYESCPQCKGAFFDAGEFRAFAEPTIQEFLQQGITLLKKWFN